MLMLIKENCMNMTNIGGREKGQFNNVYKTPYLSFRDLKENNITQTQTMWLQIEFKFLYCLRFISCLTPIRSC